MNKRALNLFLDSIGDIPVKSISLEHIDQFIKKSNTLNHSKHTINIGLRIIRTFLIWMYDREIIKKRVYDERKVARSILLEIKGNESLVSEALLREQIARENPTEIFN